jgi:protein CpxP
MKHRIILKTLAMFIIALVFQSLTIAQPQDRPMPPKGGPMPLEKIMNDLKKELKLTSEQEAKIQKIFDAQSEEMKEMFEPEKKALEVQREEMKNEHEAMREKMKKQRKKTDAKISAVLTDEQKKKFEELQKKHSQRPRRMPEPENDRPIREECPDRNE